MSDYRDTLCTVDKRGRRKWLYPEIVVGFWTKRRSIIAYSLMLFYLSMPWISIGGRQAIWLDVTQRRFVFFGTEFWATDGFLLFLVLGILAFSLFFFTALFGRVWCGWACPETVFLEFLFRPIERLTLGKATKRKRLDESPWTREKCIRKFLQHFLSAISAWIIASSALAYFIGREPLLEMMTDVPWANPVPFFLTLVMMSLMAFQFGWFREQFCTVLCPYARFQSVLMDSSSVVVGYDVVRGEPRTKASKGESSSGKGDCVDCGLCVRVCPTGIDIRNGLQLECVACTACVDACDSIMSKLNRDTGLIRYDTEDRLLGRCTNKSKLRARPFVYGFILLLFISTLSYLLVTRQDAHFQVVRGAVASTPFSILPDGRLSNQLQLKIGNRGIRKQVFTLVVEPSESVELILPENPIIIKPGTLRTIPLFVNFSQKFLEKENPIVNFTVSSEQGYRATQTVTLLGPDTK